VGLLEEEEEGRRREEVGGNMLVSFSPAFNLSQTTTLLGGHELNHDLREILNSV